MLRCLRAVHPRTHQGQVDVVHVRQHKHFLEEKKHNCGRSEETREEDSVTFSIFSNLELVLQFLFNPLGHMTKSHLPLPQFGTHMQIQLGGRTEAIPAGEIITSPNLIYHIYIEIVSVSCFSVRSRFSTQLKWISRINKCSFGRRWSVKRESHSQNVTNTTCCCRTLWTENYLWSCAAFIIHSNWYIKVTLIVKKYLSIV